MGVRGRQQKGWQGWIVGGCLFMVMIGWMAVDILRRESVVGGRSGVLVMGTNAGFKPFEYREGNDIVGFDIDLAREIARALGKQLKIEDMNFDGLLPALDSGQVTMVIAGMSVTPERQRNVAFSHAYYKAAQKIIVRRGSDIRNRYHLEGRKIAVQLGTTGDVLANDIAGARVVQFPTAPSVLQELYSGGVDAAILDDAPAMQYGAGFPSLEILAGELSNEAYAIAFKKDNPDLVNSVNKILDDIRTDGRYVELVRKYFGEIAAQKLVENGEAKLRRESSQ